MTTVDPRAADELALTDYLAILRRRWVWLVVATATVIALAAVYTLTQPPRYAATAQVSLGNSAAQDAINPNSFSNVPSASRELRLSTMKTP